MWQVPITWVVKAAVSLVQTADSRLPVSSQQGLSSGGKARLQEAASVVVCQAQRGVAGDQEVSGGILARCAGSRLHYQADAQSPVGVIVSLSPRAGSGKSAHPVVRPGKAGASRGR